jgi:serine/threonine protein kinase, bacterial
VSAPLPLKVGLEPFPGYTLRQLRGHGGFGTVWEAARDDGTTVALKFLPAVDGISASREIRSIQTVRQLAHSNLVRIDQIWCSPGYIVVSMEVAEGSLLDLLSASQAEFDAPLAADQVCSLLAGAADALDFLNARQHMLGGKKVAIQHCDVKPSNLLLFGEIVKLADFGLASPTTTRYQPHRRAGTLDFLGPEIFKGRLSERSDQYSLAVTYCQLRGGRLPFSDTPVAFDAAYTRPTPTLDMLSEPERPIIKRALHPVPQDRWPSCREMIAQLADVVT